MNLTLTSKERLTEMINGFDEKNLRVGDGLTVISERTQAISDCVSVLVRSMQFEDMTTQLVSYINKRMESINHTLVDKKYIDETLPEEGISARAYEKSFINKPILQKEMSAGTVDLF